MQEELRALIEKFCANLSGQLEEIADHVGRLENGAGDSGTNILQALDVTHQVTGLSGSMGYLEVSEAARELERYIRRFETFDVSPAAGDLEQIRTLFETLDATARKVTPQDSTLYNFDLSRLSAEAV